LSRYKLAKAEDLEWHPRRQTAPSEFNAPRNQRYSRAQRQRRPYSPQ